MGALIFFMFVFIGFIGSMAALISTGNTSVLIILIPCTILMIVMIAFVIKSFRDDKAKKKQDEENEKILAEQTATERQRQAEIEHRQHEEALKGKKYLEDNAEKLNGLIDKYYQSVYNFVENITEVSHDVFANVDYKFPETPNDTNILIAPYWQSASLLLKTKFKRDGFGFYNYDPVREGYDNVDKLQNLTKLFISGLKKRIEEKSEWEDEYTLPVAIYVIIRNNVIKYHHDLYVEEIGYESIEEFCRYQSNTQIEDTNVYFAHFYIFKNDITLPFVETYNELCLKIETEKKNQEKENLENALFGKGKEPTDDDLPEELRLENLPMKPIEKVDVMTGEEFELYMEKYFIKKGYKVVRTPLSGDYGIDLIIEHEFGKIGVQLKCYFDKVPLKAVQEVVAGLRHYGLSSGMVITNSYFQPSAIRLAGDNSITLWDRDTLIEKLES